jgi:RNA polymerase sigma-32 factor
MHFRSASKNSKRRRRLTTESHLGRSFYAGFAGIAPLSAVAERRLARAWKAGDARAGERLVGACLPFVASLAFEYRLWGIPMEDLVQQGSLGLLRAASKFDPKKKCRLSTYAAYWIRAEIREYTVRAFRVVRIGTTKSERRALRAYRTTGAGDAESLASVSGLSVERAARLLPLLGARETSLDARNDDRRARVENMASPIDNPEEQAEAHEARDRAREAVRFALEDLSEREKLIVRERLMADEPKTLQELGSRLGVSKERVRQIEERVHDKLRTRLKEVRHLAA